MSESATARPWRSHDVSLTVHPGESHALVGRNGAGKSTLVSILTGLSATDTGHVEFAGEPAPPLTRQDDWKARVACVYQHAMVVPQLTVAENLFLNRQAGGGFAIGWKSLRRKARELLDSWDVHVDVDTPAGELSVEDRQFVEIARALSYGARFIVLDEPTAQLDKQAIERLFERMRQMQAGGVTFLFISHHLHEVYEVCQAVTVLRDAKHVLTAPVAEVGKAQLVDAMTGEPGGLSVRDAASRESLEDERRGDPDGRRAVRRQLPRRLVSPAPRAKSSGWRAATPAGSTRSPRRSTACGRRPRGRSASTARRCGRATSRQRCAQVSAACRATGTTKAWSWSTRSRDNATMSILDKLGRGGIASPRRPAREGRRRL